MSLTHPKFITLRARCSYLKNAPLPTTLITKSSICDTRVAVSVSVDKLLWNNLSRLYFKQILKAKCNFCVKTNNGLYLSLM